MMNMSMEEMRGKEVEEKAFAAKQAPVEGLEALLKATEGPFVQGHESRQSYKANMIKRRGLHETSILR